MQTDQCRMCNRTHWFMLQVFTLREAGNSWKSDTLHECLPCRMNLWIVGRRFRQKHGNFTSEGPLTWVLATPESDG